MLHSLPNREIHGRARDCKCAFKLNIHRAKLNIHRALFVGAAQSRNAGKIWSVSLFFCFDQDSVTIETPDTVLLKPPSSSLTARLSADKSLPQTGQRFQFSQVGVYWQIGNPHWPLIDFKYYIWLDCILSFLAVPQFSKFTIWFHFRQFN